MLDRLKIAGLFGWQLLKIERNSVRVAVTYCQGKFFERLKKQKNISVISVEKKFLLKIADVKKNVHFT